MDAYCPRCDKEQPSQVIVREETYPVKGVPVTITANVRVCRVCGEDIFDEELDEENLRRAYNKEL